MGWPLEGNVHAVRTIGARVYTYILCRQHNFLQGTRKMVQRCMSYMSCVEYRALPFLVICHMGLYCPTECNKAVQGARPAHPRQEPAGVVVVVVGSSNSGGGGKW